MSTLLALRLRKLARPADSQHGEKMHLTQGPVVAEKDVLTPTWQPTSPRAFAWSVTNKISIVLVSVELKFNFLS